jgi:hypothetical protein
MRHIVYLANMEDLSTGVIFLVAVVVEIFVSVIIAVCRDACSAV